MKRSQYAFACGARTASGSFFAEYNRQIPSC